MKKYVLIIQILICGTCLFAQVKLIDARIQTRGFDEDKVKVSVKCEAQVIFPSQKTTVIASAYLFKVSLK